MAIRVGMPGKAQRAFDDALRLPDGSDAPRNCLGDWDRFANYIAAPSREEAEQWCAGCPLFDLCREAADESRPAWGVYAGVAYYQGHQHYNFADPDGLEELGAMLDAV